MSLTAVERAICYRMGISESAYEAQRSREQAEAAEAAKPPTEAETKRIERAMGVEKCPATPAGEQPTPLNRPK